MSSFLNKILSVQESVQDFNMAKRPKYSIYLYTGGVKIREWNRATKEEREKALSRQWYIGWSYRNSITGKLERQSNIKAGNLYKTKEERMRVLRKLKSHLTLILENGYNPNDDTSPLNLNTGNYTVEEAFNKALSIKKHTLSANSYKNFELRIRKFEKWLFKYVDISDINNVNRKVVVEYLNDVLSKTSPRTRNNTRLDLSSLFTELANNDIIQDNFISKINVLKSTPKRNKSYTKEQEKEIFDFMDKTNPVLSIFVKFVSYSFLRPVEVCRLRVKDISIEDKRMFLQAKNKLVKTKIIPDILIKELPDLSRMNPDNFLFSRHGFGQEWDASENNRRDYFTKEFAKVKKHFNLGTEYGIYSFRHTFTSKLYSELVKTMTPFEAKSNLMLITGHSTMTALEMYLRDIDAELPDDFSKYLK